MAVSDQTVHIYEELAERHARQNEARQRDLFLVLAADAAWSLGRREEAERLRQRLLAVNPNHLLRPFASFAEALESPDIQVFVADLRRQFPPETAEQLRLGRRIESAAPGKEPAPAPPDPDLKVYRVQQPEQTPVAVPAGKQPARQPPAPPRPGPGRPQPTASPYATFADKPPSARRTDEAEGGWVAVLLFVVVLLSGLALAGYTLLRPLWDL